MARDTNGDGDGGANFRISITIDPSIRRKIRLAAAIADKTPGEWCAEILERAADKAVPKLPSVRASSE